MSLFGSYVLATLAGILILIYGLQHQDSWTFIALVFAARLGISFAFCIVYVSHAPLFPTLFSATALGFCNFFSRAFSASSTIFANLDEPTPMVLLTVLSAITALLSLGI